MALQKFVPSDNAPPPSVSAKPLNFSIKVRENSRHADSGAGLASQKTDVDVDFREVYFLIMHFLSAGPCQRTCGQFWNELLEHQLLPRRYHAWYSRNGVPNKDENDDGVSFPLTYSMLAERYSHVEKDHLIKLLKQLILSTAPPSRGIRGGNTPNAADVPTLMGTGSFSLLSYDKDKVTDKFPNPPAYMRWPHMKADQVRGLRLREIGGGFSRHLRPPSIRASCYAIAKPSTMFQKMQNVKRLRGHRNSVYCATLDRSGRYVITGSDDRLVKILSMETSYCLASCRGHEGDITDLAVSSNNAVVASSSNDCIIRVWRLPDGQPISVLRGHTGAVTAIAFSPRPCFVYQLLSSSDDGTCRIWDARNSQLSPRVYVPRPSDSVAGRNNGQTAVIVQTHQIFCCAFNSSGTVFVTGSSDTLARVWSASKQKPDDHDQPNHEIDVLSGHENDVNYVQFSGCAIASRFITAEASKEDNVPKFKNSWFTHENIVTCSRDGSAIIWTPKSRRSNSKTCRWTRAYHLKVPPPPMPPQPLRGGPRQRILPTPRGVNMIIWSLDNRFVLAAIMDCRICVWNASDGSLVHSLTGHSESTYVLDVHPFNPRIAMSAGYDGKTIVWDIWEGKPIKTYEISRFKLVDGKFSPDGTSIILSDDVGQLYIVNTGQGESQKDAKYDQFFLGDYRPLIQDTYGNVLDQETQLPAFRRNMQDLLCDSGMIPYPEPYQSAYQKRRLGALGVEWNPSSLRFATGPDFALYPEFQMLPLADLDILAEPLPEFPDIMDWEPEVAMHSDDNDSEYNFPEDYLSGGDQGNVSLSSSDDSEGSEEDGKTEDAQLDSLRRSKRKKKKSETDIMTSSGRRVKRRNFDESDVNLLRNNNNRARKSKTGRKRLRKKSSKSRPQRAAALNALNLFSKITGTSTDGEEDDEDDSEVETSSESETAVQDSIVESDNGSDKSMHRSSKGKEIPLDESEELVKRPKALELPGSTRNKGRLVLKLPNKHLASRDREMGGCDNRRDDLAGPSSRTLLENGSCKDPKQDLDSLTVDDKAEHFGDGDYDAGKIKWGGAKPRTTKRPRLGDNFSSPMKLKNNSVGKTSGSELQRLEADMNGVAFGDMEANGLAHSSSVECEASGKTPKAHNSAGDEATDHKANFPSEEPEKARELEMESSVPSIPLGTEPESATKSVDGTATNGVDSNHKDSVEPTVRSDRMFMAVYRRSKLHRGANNPVGTSSNASDRNPSIGVDSHEGSNDDASCRTSSVGLKTSTNSPDIVVDDDAKLDREPESGPKLRNTLSSSRRANEEWGSSSRVTVGLRSNRVRRGSYTIRETSPIEVRKPIKSLKKGTWLMLLTHEEGPRYIPQLGDEVAYLRQGHQEYLEHNRGREQPPWVSTKGRVRDVEFCRVEKLDYAYLASGESCCKMTLVFVDPDSALYHQSFRITLPEMTGFPDFLVERTWFDASIERNWTTRDKCKVWWKNDGEEDGSWWAGRILAVKPKSTEFSDSPWERFNVQYKDDLTETHLHSPWELFDTAAVWEHPRIGHEDKMNIVTALAKLQKSSKPPQDRCGIFKLKQLSNKPHFTNKYPVPVSLDLIECRLENEYYRSVEAVKHDFEIMVSNAEDYLGNKEEISMKLKRLKDWLTKTFPSPFFE